MWGCLFFSMLLLWGPGSGSDYVEQPPFLTGISGKPRTVQCTLKQSDYGWMYWYRQIGSKELEALFYSSGNGNGSPYTTELMTAKRSENIWTLTWSNVSLSDTAVYFCTCSTAYSGASTQYFGEGTRLTVLEDGLNITEPEVAIFAPSQKEIKEKKKATLVCVATGFYPDHIKVTWKVNGGERTEGVGTDEHATRDNQTKMYSLTSRLRIPSQEWFNPKNNFQCLVSFYGKDPTPKRYPKAIQGVAGCSVTEELYQRSSRTGYFVYLMLFFKSILYGLFVMGLILRSKKMH